MKTEILGVKIDQINFSEALDLINSWIKEDSQRMVATVNPEFLVEADKNADFKKVLNSAALATCDGFGIVVAARLLKGIKLSRVTGADLTPALIENNNLKIFLLGSSQQTIAVLNKKFAHANIVGSSSGGHLDDDYQLEKNDRVLEQIKTSGANLLLVAFGQVKQEFWIKNNLVLLPNIKVAIGVGGTFDFLAGRLKRAPKLVRRLGLEWLYRLIKEPKRWCRIYNATIKFSLLAIKEKIWK